MRRLLTCIACLAIGALIGALERPWWTPAATMMALIALVACVFAVAVAVADRFDKRLALTRVIDRGLCIWFAVVAIVALSHEETYTWFLFGMLSLMCYLSARKRAVTASTLEARR